MKLETCRVFPPTPPPILEKNVLLLLKMISGLFFQIVSGTYFLKFIKYITRKNFLEQNFWNKPSERVFLE